MMRQVFTGARVFDGTHLHDGLAVVVEDGFIARLEPILTVPTKDCIALPGGVIAPGFLDLQVNGGGGRMVDGHTDLAALRHICATHLALGSAGILPTLITDTPQATARVIAAGIAAAKAQVPGFLGLHLEGPHLDPRRKGAHDPALIRAMDTNDLARLCEAARALPALMVTLAPESVTADQISVLARAGVVVSLGHSDCSFAQASAAITAGVASVTHLFNAMSQLGNREPGLVGAALSSDLACGLIADGIHVVPEVMRIALAAKLQGVFLVSDCMAFAGTNMAEIMLGGRRILRHDGRLTLEDGTLAGADLTLPQAIRVLIERVGISPERALAMASAIPAGLLHLGESRGHLAAGRRADFVHLDAKWQLAGLCMAGQWRRLAV